MALVGLAAIAADLGEHAEAAVLLGRASGLLDATGGDLTAVDQEKYRSAHASSLANLGEARLDELLAMGRGSGGSSRPR